MHPGKSDATPPVLLSDGILPGVAPLSGLEALAVLDEWQIGHVQSSFKRVTSPDLSSPK